VRSIQVTMALRSSSRLCQLRRSRTLRGSSAKNDSSTVLSAATSDRVDPERRPGNDRSTHLRGTHKDVRRHPLPVRSVGARSDHGEPPLRQGGQRTSPSVASYTVNTAWAFGFGRSADCTALVNLVAQSADPLTG